MRTTTATCASFSLLNLVRDALGLVSAFGLRSVTAVVGHDFGASVAAWCALVRPDVFRSVTLMSAPFAGPPPIPFDTVNTPAAAKAPDRVHADLAALARPRKHYQWFYSTREANADMQNCPQGVHAFLRAYYHHKSADWPDNKPYPLAGWTADELAKLPTYYVMDLDKGMAATVAEHMPTAQQIAACKWLTEGELALLQRRVCAQRLSGRAAMVSLRHQRALHLRAGSVCRPHASTCRRASSPAPATGASISGPARWRRCSAAPARR